MEKTMKARVQHKHDIEANWLKATNFTPLIGEIIVYVPDENYDYPRIKIGDGKTNINSLPFVTKNYAEIADIPTKPEDIGAQPFGNYAMMSDIPVVPVQSVNGKTGNINLNASDVEARPSSWMPTAEQVGADPNGTATFVVSQHNTNTESHNDIRLELKAINDRLTAFLDSDDQTLDELSEIIAYITNNKTLIESITTNKVSVSDIINNLVTNVTNKPLSAAQGVVLKGLIDTVGNSLSNYALNSAIPTKVSQLQNDSGYLTEHQDISGKLNASELPTAINTALAQAKASGEFDGKDGTSGVYILSEGEDLSNVPDYATVVIDPYGEPDMTIEQIVAATLEVIENGTY